MGFSGVVILDICFAGGEKFRARGFYMNLDSAYNSAFMPTKPGVNGYDYL
jgi:hypothetical protein